MAVEIKRSALVGIPCKIEEARFCPSCEIVTEREICPCCDTTPTVPHRERDSTDPRYCVNCGDGPFDAAALRVMTWSYDHYTQCEGDLICTCRPCLAERAEGDADPQAIWKD